MKRRGLLLVTLLLVAGCFPITLSVAPDGRIALVRGEGVVIYDLANDKAAVVIKPPEGKEAAWVAFSRDGKKLMCVMMSENSAGDVYVASGDGTGAKKIFTSDQPMAYATWSPDAKYIAVGEVSQEGKGDLGNLVNVRVVDVATGQGRDVARDVTQVHDWTADSSAVVAFQGDAKAGENGVRGKLMRFGLDGNTTVLAKAIAGKELSVDVSTDGRTVLLTASVAVRADAADPAVPEKPEENILYAVPAAGGDPVVISKKKVSSAFFSPDGRHILISTEDGDLIVTDADGKNAKTLDRKVLNQSVGMMDSARMLPTWASNDRVIYWKSLTVIGMKGKNLATTSVNIDGTERTNLQPKMDWLLQKQAED
ncbi:MAG TPA: hypothetical protein VMX57_09695 [Planctomycetota bacterium]|nr:hypothetical protein [Planctomycetota bacterium]